MMLTYEGNPVRDEFDLVDESVYLRTGNICPCPRSVARAVSHFVNIWQTGGDACWDLAQDAFEHGKDLFARLIGAQPGEIATIENTSMGLSIAAALIGPQPGSNVVVEDLTHPSNVYPWMLRPGVEIRYAPAIEGCVPPSAFEPLVDDHTAAIDVCHVTMGHGYRHDLLALADLAHQHGAYLVVDAAQSAGIVPIDVGVMHVDFLSCPTFKWLFGPLGAGFLYVRKDLLHLSPPPLVGWMSGQHPERFDIRAMELHDDARRLQRGVHNATGLVAALAGLKIVDHVGPHEIWSHVRVLSGRLLEGLDRLGLRVLTPADDQQRAGIVTLCVDDTATIHQRLATRGVLAGQYLPGQIRMDVALFHDEKEIDRTLEAIEALCRKQSLA